MITQLVSPQRFDGEALEVEGPAYQHLFRSRRLGVGARLRVVDGAGRARWGEIARVDRRRAVVDLGDEAPSNEPSYRLELIVAALRAERASWLVEKATELGVSKIRFIATERTPRRFSEARLERLRRVAAAAVLQCHRARVPEIAGFEAWEAVRSRLESRDPGDEDRAFLHPGAGRDGSRRPRRDAGLVLVGPEGGWSPLEAAELAELGCRSVSFGPRILRVETAAVVAAAAWLHRRG